MEIDNGINGRLRAAFGTAPVEMRELATRDCVVTHSVQIRVGTTASLVLRLDDQVVSVRASVLKSSLLAPSLEGMIYRSILRIDAGDGIRMKIFIPLKPSDEAITC